METLTAFVTVHSQHAHFWIFGLLLLAGLNIPISEDILLIVGGLIAYKLSAGSALYLYLWVFLGCCLSAWEAYWLGRLLGPKIVRHRWLGKVVTEERLRKIEGFYARYGIWTFFVGRFIPFGVRNCLFISSGMGRMPFLRFMLRDSIACLVSSGTLFYLAYCFGKNYQMLYEYLHAYQRIVGVLLAIVIGYVVILRRYTRAKSAAANLIE